MKIRAILAQSLVLAIALTFVLTNIQFTKIPPGVGRYKQLTFEIIHSPPTTAPGIPAVFCAINADLTATNTNLSTKQNKAWTELGRDLTTATLPSGFNEAIVYIYSSNYGVEFFLSANAPTKAYYTGSNTSGYVGASVSWNLNSRTLTGPTINVSGSQSTGNMMVVYR